MSHVPRVGAFGHGNTSSRTPLMNLAPLKAPETSVVRAQINLGCVALRKKKDPFLHHSIHFCKGSDQRRMSPLQC